MEIRVKKFRCPFLIIVPSLTSYKLNGEQTIITKYTHFSDMARVGGLVVNAVVWFDPSPKDQNLLDSSVRTVWQYSIRICTLDPFSIFELPCECWQSVRQLAINSTNIMIKFEMPPTKSQLWNFPAALYSSGTSTKMSSKKNLKADTNESVCCNYCVLGQPRLSTSLSHTHTPWPSQSVAAHLPPSRFNPSYTLDPRCSIYFLRSGLCLLPRLLLTLCGSLSPIQCDLLRHSYCSFWPPLLFRLPPQPSPLVLQTQLLWSLKDVPNPPSPRLLHNLIPPSESLLWTLVRVPPLFLGPSEPQLLPGAFSSLTAHSV